MQKTNNNVPSHTAKGRALGMRYYVIYLLLTVASIGLIIFGLWRNASFPVPPLGFGGQIALLAAIVVFNMSVKIALNGWFGRASRKLDPANRLSYLEFISGKFYSKKPHMLAQVGLVQAQMHLKLGDVEQAERALDHVQTDNFNKEQQKLYYLLWFVVTRLQRSEQEAKDWLVRYTGITGTGLYDFPDSATVSGWVNVSSEQELSSIAKQVGDLQPAPLVKHPILSFLLGALFSHAIFFFGAQASLGPGWQMRSPYYKIALPLACLALILLGIFGIRTILRFRQKTNGKETGMRRILTVIGFVAWMVFMTAMAALTFLGGMVENNRSEKVIASDIEDAYDGYKWDYLAVDEYSYDLDMSQTSYYRTRDFLFMESWSEAEAYDVPEENLEQ